MNTKSNRVEAGKRFSVSAQQLFDAWTNPEQLKQWWKPLGKSLKEVINDISKGGAVKYITEDESLVITGEYLEVEQPNKLVYTWNWELPKDTVKNASYKLSVEFKDVENESEILVVQEGFENEESLQPHKDGWNKGLEDLAKYLSSTITEDGSSEAEGSGYHELSEQLKVGGV